MLHPNAEMEIAKTHEIMSRYRPIAPKPSLPGPPSASPTAASSSSSSFCLKPRPCRARKRISTGIAPANSTKRQRPVHSTTAYLPILPVSLPNPAFTSPPLVEQDLLKKLQEPKVLVPQPVRPVGSTITATCIAFKEGITEPSMKKSAETIEEELEMETAPAVVSDSKNKVRVTNCAYKEMVGQPECMWLDTLVGAECGSSVMKKRINGEVVLEVEEPTLMVGCSSGFSCVVKVGWVCDGMRSFVDAPCDVVRLWCEGRDYLFVWKIHALKDEEIRRGNSVDGTV